MIALDTSVLLRLLTRDDVQQALAWFEEGAVGFADCLVAARARAEGCEALATFDRRMGALPGARVLHMSRERPGMAPDRGSGID